MVSPLHRDPSSNDSDYGCFTKKANKQVASLVNRTVEMISTGTLRTGDQVIDVIRPELERIGQGATDTVVKENVFFALQETLAEAGVEMDQELIYGW